MNSENISWKIASIEYQSALTKHQGMADLRRRDLLFVTAVQGAVLTIAGKDLIHLSLSYVLLSLIAFAVSLFGFNTERRLSAYMRGYTERAAELERNFGMNLLTGALHIVKQQKFLVSNKLTFKLYYLMLAAGWIIVWLINILA